MVEASNPFMHARYIYLDLAVDARLPSLYLYYHPSLYNHNSVLIVALRVNEVLFALTYFVGRILFGTWLVYVAHGITT